MGQSSVDLLDPYFDSKLKTVGNYDFENCTMKQHLQYAFQISRLHGDESTPVIKMVLFGALIQLRLANAAYPNDTRENMALRRTLAGIKKS